MNPKIEISKEFQEKINRASERWPFRMHKAFRWAARYAASQAGKRTSGPVLKVQSNKLRSTLAPFVRRRGKDIIQAGIYTKAWYGAIHEWGLTAQIKKGPRKGLTVTWPERPFLRPSVMEGVEKLIEQIEVWEE
jgi:phage gpG-like protein